MTSTAGVWETIPAMTTSAAEQFGDRLAIVDGDTRRAVVATSLAGKASHYALDRVPLHA